MKTSTVVKLSGLVGAGLVILGAIMYSRERKNAALGNNYRYISGHFAEAPAVDGYVDDETGAKTTMRAAENLGIEQRIASIQKMIYQSVQDPMITKLAMKITEQCPERDGKCEAKSIYKWMKRHIRYTGDVSPIVHPNGDVEGIDRYATARRTIENGSGDCLPASTLVLRDDYQLIPLIELDPGDRIMGQSGWTQVLERWLTGEKELLEFDLSNGCVLRCTPEHRIFRDVDGRLEEIRAGEAKVGDDLVTADEIPTHTEQFAWPDVVASLSGEERAWLLGAFVADGWTEESRAAISGLDGHFKEAQKRRVEEMMMRSGVSTQWNRKYIRMNDRDLSTFFARAGRLAPNKRVPDLRFASKAEVQALLDGLSADADRRSGVFGTTSPQLALQLRVIHRMLGRSVSITRVDDHGGFGSHPIYRITPREMGNERRDIRFARIRAIRQGESELCMDLTTDSGKFWLPESDVLVHNCDDQVIVAASLGATIGLPMKLRVTAECADASECDESHIYPVALLPKFASQPEYAIALDTTLPGSYSFGVEAPAARVTDYDA